MYIRLILEMNVVFTPVLLKKSINYANSTIRPSIKLLPRNERIKVCGCFPCHCHGVCCRKPRQSYFSSLISVYLPPSLLHFLVK